MGDGGSQGGSEGGLESGPARSRGTEDRDHFACPAKGLELLLDNWESLASLGSLEP